MTDKKQDQQLPTVRTEVAIYEGNTALTGQTLKAQVNMIQDVLKKVMKEGHHYGTIPGTGERKTLLKPGSEKILMTFHLASAPEKQHVEDLSGPDVARYRVHCPLIYIPTGSVVAIGLGECSSDEEKYKWRRAVCEEEWNETPEDRRRKKWQKGRKANEKPTQIMQVRTNPADVANTILKMAKKRAQIDATLSGTGCSDIFSQDYDEMTAEHREQLIDEVHGVIREPKAKEPPKQEPAAKKPEAKKPAAKRAAAKKKEEPVKDPEPSESGPEDFQSEKEEDKDYVGRDDITDCEYVDGMIENVTLKDGTKDGRAWRRYDISLGGNYYNTFDKPISDFAEQLLEEKAIVRIFYKIFKGTFKGEPKDYYSAYGIARIGTSETDVVPF